MVNDIKGQLTQDPRTTMAEMELSLNRKLPYARPIITKLDLGTEDIRIENLLGADGGTIACITHS